MQANSSTFLKSKESVGKLTEENKGSLYGRLSAHSYTNQGPREGRGGVGWGGGSFFLLSK